MTPRRVFLAALLLAAPALAAGIPADIAAISPGPIQVAQSVDALTVTWPGPEKRSMKAEFSLDDEKPLITAISIDGKNIVERANPFYQVETGVRRRGWNAFFDYPPSHPEGTRRFHLDFKRTSAKARSLGNRVEIYFEGLRLGLFEGGLSYTFFPGSALIQQEAVAATQQDNVAYYYDAGIEFDGRPDRTPGRNMRTEFAFYNTEGKLQTIRANGLEPERQPEKVRYRTLAAKTAGGSIAVFPAPHQYFFPRDFTSNLGYLWRRAWRDRISLGIRQIGDTNWQFYPWVNAPPGKAQRMGLFLLLSGQPPAAVLDQVLRYTNRDRFPPVEGYKTLSTHWHLAYTEQAVANGPNWTPPFKPVLKEMGVDASIIMDFHGDGHPRDLTELRLTELDQFFAACRAQSGPDFLLIPAEEANVHLGGHWAVVFPEPVYWFMNRPDGGQFEMGHPKFGTVFSAANEAEMLELVRREGGYMYQTHPRTKGSTGYPDKIRDTPHFRDPRYLGAGWKAMPADNASPRLGDRSLDLLDDMSNWGLPKRTFGEVDVFQFDHTHELYAHMNINYVRLDRLPVFDHWEEALKPWAEGEFFTTTGEVLLPSVEIDTSSENEIAVTASARWTFPLKFAEIVWGDGEKTGREVIPLDSTEQFGQGNFSWKVTAPGWKWARLALWDIATNGAFVNPTWRVEPSSGN